MTKLVKYILILDVLTVISVLIPSLFGYVGSEQYEWSILFIIVFGTPLGVVLSLYLLYVKKVNKRR